MPLQFFKILDPRIFSVSPPIHCNKRLHPRVCILDLRYLEKGHTPCLSLLSEHHPSDVSVSSQILGETNTWKVATRKNNSGIIQYWSISLPSQIISRPRISLNFIFLSSWPFWTLHPATASFFFPTVTLNVARTEASPEAWENVEVKNDLKNNNKCLFLFVPRKLSGSYRPLVAINEHLLGILRIQFVFISIRVVKYIEISLSQ